MIISRIAASLSVRFLSRPRNDEHGGRACARRATALFLEKGQLHMSSQTFEPPASLEPVLTDPLIDSDVYSRAIFDHVLDCITVADPSGRIEYVNAAACETFGYSRLEFLGRSIPDLIAPDELPRLVQTLRSKGLDNVSYGEWRSRRKDGSIFFSEVSVTTLSDGRVLGIGRDITARKRAEAELNRVQQMLEAFVHYAPAAIAMFDRNMCYLRSSLQWRIGTGLSEEPLAGKCHYDVFPDIPESWKAVYRRGLAGEVVRGETEWPRADGVPVQFRWEVHPWGDAGVSTGGVISLFEDVTEARKIEAQLRNAQKMDAVGRLAGGVAHEFRNALCVILLQLDLAKTGVSPGSDASAHLEAIQKAARHAGTITENLLAFSRKRTFNPEPFVLDNFVRELATVVRPLAGDHIRVDLRCGTGEARILFDPMQLEQVLINLVCNAVDAMQSSTGVLTIETLRQGRNGRSSEPKTKDYLVLSVQDTGTGISPEFLPHIFEPFFTTKEVGKGTGLGLSISYGIVTHGEGKIEVESVLGQGSRFDLLLPKYGRG
jgi:two-component system cell cycle sensor histidine kinase/response regulator CckA